MVNRIYIILTFLMLIVFNRYLYDNITTLGQGSFSLVLLVIVLSLGVILALWNLLPPNRIYIKYSVFFLAVFYIYFVFRIVLDIGDMNRLKAMTIATTGGTFLFYILGVLFAVALGRIICLATFSKQALKMTIIAVLVYMTISLFFLYGALLELVPLLRNDLFLISDLQGAYQRPGNFIAISFLILSLIFMIAVSLNQGYRTLIYKGLAPFLFLIYLAQGVGLIIFSQMIGSNKSMVVVAGLMLITLVVYFLIIFPKITFYLKTTPLKLVNLIFGIVGRRVVGTLFVSIFLLIGTVGVAVIIGEVDVTTTRIMNFGKGGLSSSVSSRLSIAAESFPIQFNYSPFFGNMNVDALTTGRGSYTHSFLGMSMTHLGIFGTFFFILYLLQAVKELLIKKSQCYPVSPFIVEKITKLHFLLMFSVVATIALLGTAITWIVFWFSIGLLTCPITFRRTTDIFGAGFKEKVQ